MTTHELPITGQELEETQYEHPSRAHVVTPEPSRLARDLRDAIYDIDRRDPDALEAHAEFLAMAADALRYARERRMKRLQGRA